MKYKDQDGDGDITTKDRHKSKEPATVMILEALDIPVFLDCDMCLGEGTGAVTIYPILDMALAVYGSMSTFADIQMDNYVPLV